MRFGKEMILGTQMSNSCIESGCPHPSSARGLCKSHYMKRRCSGTLPQLATPKSERERFFEKTRWTDDVHPILKTKCLLWTGAKNLSGYGVFQVGTHDHPKTELASRTVWRLENGSIPGKGCVLHKRDSIGGWISSPNRKAIRYFPGKRLLHKKSSYMDPRAMKEVTIT
jgi:hypothetical protein